VVVTGGSDGAGASVVVVTEGAAAVVVAFGVVVEVVNLANRPRGLAVCRALATEWLCRVVTAPAPATPELITSTAATR